MRLFRSVLDYYINSSIHVALAVCAMSCITMIQFDLNIDKDVLFFTFFATITGYNFVKFFGIAKFHHRRLTSRLRSIQLFSLLAFILMTVFFFRLQTITMVLITAFGLVTFLYAIPILPKHLFIDQQRNLRSISGLKIYIIALVWTGVTVLLPLIDNHVELSEDIWYASLQRFLIVIVLMLPFEIRDLNFDSLKLSTVPQNIGIRGTKILGILLLIVVFSLEYCISDYRQLSIWLHAIFVMLLAIFLLLSYQRQSRYYSSFWVESLPLWWLGLLLMFS